jgi:hypothetical protein
VPERPLLRLPNPEAIAPPRPPRGGQSVTKPSRGRQVQRLAPRFDRLVRVAGDPQQVMQLRADPEAIAPERAIVFEVAGSIVEFYQRAADIGLEYLADDETEFDPDDDFQIKDKPEEEISGRIYLAMPDVEALRQLVQLWRRYVAGQRMADGFGMWTQLFGLLKDVRPWGPQDRIPPETLEFWNERLQEAPDEPVRFEVELWYRENPVVRTRSFTALNTTVADLGGQIIDHAVISEIRYDAALIDLPAARIRLLMDDPTVSLARADEIMYIRPQTVAEFPVDDDPTDDLAEMFPVGGNELPPIAALLDGFPVQNHQRLAGRLIIDDPDDFADGYVAAARKHGTEMASLILHGDINRGEPPLERPLYVRPVMQPVQTLNGWEERTSADRLLIDLIYRAVRRIKEADGDEPAAAPTVTLVNLSLGDPHRPFAGPMSPWARLLDYLAYRYRILFLVSAGNVTDAISLPGYANWSDFENASVEDRERAVFEAINESKAYRTLFSPAEAMNIITVGAAHRDGSAVRAAAMAVDPIGTGDLPNVSSAVGLGFKKVIKPDILLDGGREHVQFQGTNPHLHVRPSRVSGRAFGLLAAVPDPAGVDLSRTGLTWGTSGATALATRAGHRVLDALMDRDGGSFLADTPPQYQALIVKALLLHGAAWGQRIDMIEEIVGGPHYPKKDGASRLLGYGVLDVARIVECTAERATLIGFGEVTPGAAILHRVPLPPGLDGVREYRAVTTTLSWFSPINPRHQGYRMAALEAGAGGDSEYSLGVQRAKAQPHDKAIKRGTVFHDRREGERAAAFVNGGDLLLRVSARATAGEYDQPVPYALAISIEVGVGSTIQVYDEVRAIVEARVRPPISP